MIRFFKHTGPLQVGVLFLLTFLLRLPVFVTDAPLLLEDLKHLVVAEKMANGFMLYRDILDSTPPFSAFIYWLITCVFGRSPIAFHFFAAILVLCQSFIFKTLCNNNDLFSEKGDIPALIYGISAIICYDFLSLSPSMISLTFILAALNSIFKHIRVENKEGEIFTTGFYIGMAYLSFAPSIIFFGMAYFTFLFFTRTSFRYYLLFFIGFLFPVLFMLTFFFCLDGLNGFLRCFLFNFPVNTIFSISFDKKSIAYIALPTFLISLTGILRAFTYRRFIIYQVISQRLMFFWLLMVIGAVILFFDDTTSSYMMLVPFTAFFSTHFFHLIKRKSLSGWLLYLYILCSLRVIYSYLPIQFLHRDLINYNHQVSFEGHWNKQFQGKKVLHLGEDLNVYRNNTLATPYLHWKLSGLILENSDYYSEAIRLYNDFKNDMPDVIIDEKNVMPAIFRRIPFLKESYPSTSQTGVYLRKTRKLSDPKMRKDESFW